MFLWGYFIERVKVEPVSHPKNRRKQALEKTFAIFYNLAG